MLAEWTTSSASVRLLSVISLCAGGLSAVWLAIDEIRLPQRMWIMNLVWPLTALYSGPIALYAYYRFGRSGRKRNKADMDPHDSHPRDKKPRGATYALAAMHCGSGCTLGDLIAEWFLYFFPMVLIWFGYPWLFPRPIFAGWVLDFVLAFILGLAFQYFTIVPMRHLSVREGVLQAAKADCLSLVAWQIGMYGWMAIATFLIFGKELEKTNPVFWFMMQIAMIAGFVTSYPVNIWLVSSGIKESM